MKGSFVCKEDLYVHVYIEYCILDIVDCRLYFVDCRLYIVDCIHIFKHFAD